MGWLNSTWTWLCGGLGVTALVVMVTQTRDVSTPEPPDPQPVVMTSEAVANPQSSGNSDVEEALEKGPEIVFDTPASAPETPLESSINVTLQADRAVVTTSAPSASNTPEIVILPPEVSDDSINALAVPETAQGSGSSLTDSSAPAPRSATAPLTLAQVLPPGAAPQPGQIAPSFDLVRVAPDGSAVIAGRAEPNAQVQVFSGDVPVGEATASARGEFVVFLTNPSEPTMDIQIPEAPDPAQLVVSQDDIVILPALSEAPDATPVVLRRTPDAVQIVQPSGPAIPSNVSLDLVSYSASGSVVLAGRGQPQNTARIYANGELAGEITIASGGDWRLEIDDIAEGRYVLRVDEIDAEGAVLSRTESPFQREFPEAQMPESFSQGAKIIVQPGNTLWLMATEAYGNGDAFTQIFSANSEAIRDPDLIYPGQIFSIPRLGE